MIDNRILLAEQAAQNILEYYGIDNPTDIPLSDIILARGASYEEKPLLNKEGEMISVNGNGYVYVNSNTYPITRRRFAAAHELGHFELHRDLRPLFTDTSTTLLDWYQNGSQEREANAFAAELLMPTKLFAKNCFRKAFSPELMDQIMQTFEVSATAAILKFLKVGSQPIFIAFGKDNRIEWKCWSKDFQHYCDAKFLLRPMPGSVAHEVLATGTPYLESERRQRIVKSSWFPLKDDEEDIEMYEWCLYSKPANSYLSVVWDL